MAMTPAVASAAGNWGALAMLNAVAPLIPAGAHLDDYVNHTVPAGIARDLLRAMLYGEFVAFGHGMAEVPVTVWVPVAGLRRFVTAWTGDDGDMFMSAERAVQARLGLTDDEQGVELVLDGDQEFRAGRLRAVAGDITAGGPLPADVVAPLFEVTLQDDDRVGFSVVVRLLVGDLPRLAAAWTGRHDDVVRGAQQAMVDRLAAGEPARECLAVEWVADPEAAAVMAAMGARRPLPWT